VPASSSELALRISRSPANSTHRSWSVPTQLGNNDSSTWPWAQPFAADRHRPPVFLSLLVSAGHQTVIEQR
jgi:hypothetical protein